MSMNVVESYLKTVQWQESVYPSAERIENAFSESNNTVSSVTGINNVTTTVNPTGTVGSVIVWIVSTLVSLVTTIANAMVIVSFLINKKLRQNHNILLMNLAVADFCVGLVSMNLFTLFIVNNAWTLGAFLCDLWLALDYVASNASVMNLLIICVDRYLSVTKVVFYRNRLTRNMYIIASILAWTISLFLWAPWITLWQYIVDERTVGENECFVQFINDSKGMTVATSVFAFYAPAASMCVLYWRVSVAIRNSKKKRGKKERAPREKHIVSVNEKPTKSSSSEVNSSETKIETTEDHKPYFSQRGLKTSTSFRLLLCCRANIQRDDLELTALSTLAPTNMERKAIHNTCSTTINLATIGSSEAGDKSSEKIIKDRSEEDMIPDDDSTEEYVDLPAQLSANGTSSCKDYVGYCVGNITSTSIQSQSPFSCKEYSYDENTPSSIQDELLAQNLTYHTNGSNGQFGPLARRHTCAEENMAKLFLQSNCIRLANDKICDKSGIVSTKTRAVYKLSKQRSDPTFYTTPTYWGEKKVKGAFRHGYEQQDVKLYRFSGKEDKKSQESDFRIGLFDNESTSENRVSQNVRKNVFTLGKLISDCKQQTQRKLPNTPQDQSSVKPLLEKLSLMHTSRADEEECRSIGLVNIFDYTIGENIVKAPITTEQASQTFSTEQKSQTGEITGSRKLNANLLKIEGKEICTKSERKIEVEKLSLPDTNKVALNTSDSTLKIGFNSKPRSLENDHSSKLADTISVLVSQKFQQPSTNRQALQNKMKKKFTAFKIEKAEDKHFQKEARALRLLFFILTAFIMLWLPYNIIVIYAAFCGGENSVCIPDIVWNIGYWLCYINSTINPLCYPLCIKEFKDTFTHLLSLKWLRIRSCRYPPPSSYAP